MQQPRARWQVWLRWHSGGQLTNTIFTASRSSSFSQASTIALFPGSFDTDSKLTKTLWTQVMAPSRRTSGIPAPAGSRSSSQRTHSVQSGLSYRTASSAARLGDKTFEDSVLAPRGIVIVRQQPFVDPFGHFKSPIPTEGKRVEHYYSQPGLEHCTIWLEGDKKFLKRQNDEYTYMKFTKKSGAEFQQYALEKFFKNEPRQLTLEDHRGYLCERVVNTTLKPEDGNALWAEPPETCHHLSIAPYSFDIRPDCSYWISLQPFNKNYQGKVQGVVSVQEDLLCPYLTIEFKKDDQAGASQRKAEQQVAVAGSLALYSRYLFHKSMLDLLELGYAEEYWQEIRHYGITFAGPEYKIWVLKPTVNYSNGDWQGCTISILSAGDLVRDIVAVDDLVNWTNEIHRWGLLIHGAECHKDARIRLYCTDGRPRTSLTPEEFDRMKQGIFDSNDGGPPVNDDGKPRTSLDLEELARLRESLSDG
ncbi:hypothetical protein CC80DRAFT_48061 [Byssothecium circinans]|uniref:Uncharacterized protein n=1 Tax=Byssothecium circinans TaxID=147558 RepID=A0A6A5U3R5_9PLEO|nr:hypothetical protein CC80DRAFT_48061 [Byssothecium circinans]